MTEKTKTRTAHAPSASPNTVARAVRFIEIRRRNDVQCLRTAAPDSRHPYRQREGGGMGTVSLRDGDIREGDNLPILRRMKSASVPLIYIDPPFNTGKTQTRTRLKTVRDDAGDRVGFGGHRYRTTTVGVSGYADAFDDYVGFLRPRLEEAWRILAPNGSLFFHIDWRESARCRLLLEDIFGGPEYCLNEIIWAYDYGARSTHRWPAKHDNIYWFAKNPHEYIFNYDEMDRIPYMAPGMVGRDKAARGKTPTDTWWHTIVPTNGKERTGYPTQKPLTIVSRIVRAHSRPGDVVLDFFAGSGTTGDAARQAGRRFVLVDNHPDAISVMKGRLGGHKTLPRPSTTRATPTPAKRGRPAAHVVPPISAKPKDVARVVTRVP